MPVRSAPASGPARLQRVRSQIMYAVIKTGGKQYRVSPGDVIKVERLAGEVGETIAFDQVLMVGDAAATGPDRHAADRRRPGHGRGARAGRAPKVIVFKKKRRKNYRRKRGHRQLQTVLRIQDIALA